MEWYYELRDQEVGPVSEKEFGELVAADTITAATLVWRPGLPEWKTYGALVAADPALADRAICAVSGKVRWKHEMLQYEERWISAEHREEFFQRLREGAVSAPFESRTVPGPHGYAGFWIRAAARLIDALALTAVAIPLFFLVGMLSAVVGFRRQEIGTLLVIALLAGLLGGKLLYEVYFIRRHDGTPGKQALGLKIFRPDGRKLSTGRIVGRYFATLAVSQLPFGLGHLFVAFDPAKRGLPDRLCDTRVIRTRR